MTPCVIFLLCLKHSRLTGFYAEVVTLTTESYDNLKYYVQYSASAYCNSDDSVGALVTCEGGCPEVMANGATIFGVMP